VELACRPAGPAFLSAACIVLYCIYSSNKRLKTYPPRAGHGGGLVDAMSFSHRSITTTTRGHCMLSITRVIRRIDAD